MSLKGKTLFITGASRGIGKAIALRAARDGANIVIAARTEEPGGKLAGTIHQTVQEVTAAGGHGLALATDVRSEESVEKAVAMATAYFGGIDVLINNAGAISPTSTFGTSLKLFDLMMATNVRAAFLCTKTCLPYLVVSANRGRNPHVLNLTPPLNMTSPHMMAYPPYAVSKYGMSILTLAMANEFSGRGIMVNGLWPRKVIATDALRMIKSIDRDRCRRPEIMAEAAHAILIRKVGISGMFFTDEVILNIDGAADLSGYAVVPGTPDKDLVDDLFLY